MRSIQHILERLWLKALILALLGYAVFGKGFAYLYAGEIILVLGVLIFVRSGRLMFVFADPLLTLWAVFACWGLWRTIPFIPVYGSDAIRDAVLWGYGVFALLIAAFVNNTGQITRVLNAYRRWSRWYLPILPVLVLCSFQLASAMPTIPWSPGVAIIALKGGDAAVHLTGAALFTLIFIRRQRAGSGQDVALYKVVVFMAAACAAFMLLIITRAGFIAFAASFLVASILSARRIGWKVPFLAVTAAAIALAVLQSGIIEFKHHGRTFTTEQIAANLGSIVGRSDEGDLQGTKEWRLIWWKNIIDYTIYGHYFWTGKGFGVNLADADQGGPHIWTAGGIKLRSPHNGNMTVLARMGVPGLALWLILQISFAARLVIAYFRARSAGSPFWSNVTLWILCYWIAAVINMSFDVYIEGPQGGIWFWSIIGFGIAAMRIQAHTSAAWLPNRTTSSVRIPRLAASNPVVVGG